MAILNVRFWLNCLRHEYYHLDSHALWQFTFTAADGDAAVCNSSGGWNRIWKIMEMYLRRWCFISVWALWKIKISLCLWEVRGWGWEGLAVCERKCARRCKSFSADWVPGPLVCCVRGRGCSSDIVLSKTSRQNVTKGANHELTSASPDVLLWSQKYLSSSSHSRSFIKTKHTAGFCKHACSRAWKRALVGNNQQTKKELKIGKIMSSKTKHSFIHLCLRGTSQGILSQIATDCMTIKPFWPDAKLL